MSLLDGGWGMLDAAGIADGMLEVYAAYARGAGAVVTDEVEKATGRSATDVPTFLRDHAAAFRTV